MLAKLVQDYRTQKNCFFLPTVDLISWELLLIFYLMALGSRKAGSLMEGFIRSWTVGLQSIGFEYSVDSLKGEYLVGIN